MSAFPEKLVALWNETAKEPIDPFLGLLAKLDEMLPLSTAPGRGEEDCGKPTRGS